MNIEAFLKDPRSYLTALEELQIQRDSDRLSYLSETTLDQLDDILHNKAKFSKECARLIPEGKWTFQPLCYKRSTIKNKVRSIFYVDHPKDLVVFKTTTMGLENFLSPYFSDNLYSFRKNKHFFHIIKNLKKFTLQHRLHHTSPQSRGLYVFKTDIESYSSSIPTDPESLLWKKLSVALDINNPNFLSLLKQIVSPPRKGFEDKTIIPMGHLPSNLLVNFYLSSMDAIFEHEKDIFYARYCDDILFISACPHKVLAAKKTIESTLLAHRLKLSAKKTSLIFWNGAGKGSSESDFKGSECVHILGQRLHFTGHVSLPKDKLKKLFNEVYERIDNASIFCKHLSMEEKKSFYLSHIQDLFNPGSPLALSCLSNLLYTTNPEQIKQIKYLITLKIASYISSEKGVRAFRNLSPSSLFTKELVLWNH